METDHGRMYCSNCGGPATARIVEQSEECDYGLVCDSCKTHPAVRRWIPLGQPNTAVSQSATSVAPEKPSRQSGG